MPLRPPEFYQERSIDFSCAEVIGLDARARQITLADGRTLPFDKLLLATGAEPTHLDIPVPIGDRERISRNRGYSPAISLA
jgi:apoptosis-inducing factor 3